MKKPFLIHFEQIGDNDIGFISVCQSQKDVPFLIRRVYWVYHTPDHVERGNHAHKKGQQLLVCVSGETTVQLENIREEKYSFTLKEPHVGLFIPPMYWRVIHMKADTVFICMADTDFNEDDYIRDYHLFKNYHPH
ncbi:MAG: FdtA/QdtA family cupin domain-containing protein [Cytophagaceae bacterium]|nr:FdtA/QdtA family cupin domain-containing protein [Cytophagaceae bacterium]MDW8456637.1 FdtA/QdtA family cupin domain-containing protein [Cytophagaceae bacterium]